MRINPDSPHNPSGGSCRTAVGFWTSLLVLALLLTSCVPAAEIIFGGISELAKDARDKFFVTRVGEEVVTTQQLDLAVQADPSLSRDQALGKIIDVDILVSIGRDSGFDARGAVPGFARQNADQIEKARTLLNITQEQMNKNIEKSLLAGLVVTAFSHSIRVNDAELASYYAAHKAQYRVPFKDARTSIEQDVKMEKLRDYLDFLHVSYVRELKAGYADPRLPSDDSPMDPRTELQFSIVIVLAGCVVIGVIEWILARQGDESSRVAEVPKSRPGNTTTI